MVAQHGYPAGSDAGSETGEMLGVVAAVAQHGGMHHAAAHDLQPAGAFADHAAFTAAQKTFHVHLSAGLSEGEVRGAQADLDIIAEQAAGEPFQGALHIGEGDVLTNRQHLNLLELHIRAHAGLLVAVAHAGQHHAHRLRGVGAHGVDLSR